MTANVVDKVAIYFALEHSFKPNIVKAYCILLCNNCGGDVVADFWDECDENLPNDTPWANVIEIAKKSASFLLTP